jgi:hypothetical protein
VKLTSASIFFPPANSPAQLQFLVKKLHHGRIGCGLLGGAGKCSGDDKNNKKEISHVVLPSVGSAQLRIEVNMMLKVNTDFSCTFFFTAGVQRFPGLAG